MLEGTLTICKGLFLFTLLFLENLYELVMNEGEQHFYG
ncbi:hypothetical protein ICY_01895 [Bacillus cereus BAG2X1-3]|nr:hypothetical protein ICU_02025 [Bacillus cereus BAG2X1-1]EJS76884.1 hypothetical protein ICY_01895 [Bacillus cereus BAG2X1-3]